MTHVSAKAIDAEAIQIIVEFTGGDGLRLLDCWRDIVRKGAGEQQVLFALMDRIHERLTRIGIDAGPRL